MVYATLLKTSQGYFLQADRNGAVQACKEAGKIRRSVEDAYDLNHQRGYEASMSACLHFIQFHPTEVTIPDDPKNVQAMLDETGGSAFMSIASISGHYYGWKITEEVALKLLEDAKNPALISEMTFEKKLR